MSITVQAADLTRIRDLISLYLKKGAFEPDETVDVGTIYKNLVASIKNLGSSTTASLSVKDATYMLSAMNVCAQRSPIELQNYKPIFSLFETLSALLKEYEDEQNEGKADA